MNSEDENSSLDDEATEDSLIEAIDIAIELQEAGIDTSSNKLRS